MTYQFNGERSPHNRGLCSQFVLIKMAPQSSSIFTDIKCKQNNVAVKLTRGCCETHPWMTYLSINHNPTVH